MRYRRALLTLAVTSTLALVLHRLRDGTIHLTSPGAAATSISERSTPSLAVELVRLAALGLACYVTAVGSVAVLRDLLCCRPARSGWLTPAVVRRLLGLGVAGALVVPSVATAAPRTTDAPVLVQVDGASSTTTVPAPPPTLVRTDAGPAAGSPTVAGASVWRVAPGDHFWAIADRTVRAHDASADEVAVARYWRTLVDANRDRLAVAGEPDLVFAGQELVLPPVT